MDTTPFTPDQNVALNQLLAHAHVVAETRGLNDRDATERHLQRLRIAVSDALIEFSQQPALLCEQAA